MLNSDEVLELTRLFIFDDYGKNTESIVYIKNIQVVERKCTRDKRLISYSDPEQGHMGIIYQATNWVYQGNDMRLMGNYGVKLSEDGDWMHSRKVYLQSMVLTILST